MKFRKIPRRYGPSESRPTKTIWDTNDSDSQSRRESSPSSSESFKGSESSSFRSLKRKWRARHRKDKRSRNVQSERYPRMDRNPERDRDSSSYKNWKRDWDKFAKKTSYRSRDGFVTSKLGDADKINWKMDTASLIALLDPDDHRLPPFSDYFRGGCKGCCDITACAVVTSSPEIVEENSFLPACPLGNDEQEQEKATKEAEDSKPEITAGSPLVEKEDIPPEEKPVSSPSAFTGSPCSVRRSRSRSPPPRARPSYHHLRRYLDYPRIGFKGRPAHRAWKSPKGRNPQQRHNWNNRNNWKNSVRKSGPKKWKR